MSTESLQLKYPVVLIHGLGARSSYGPFEYFYGLPKILKGSGNQIYIANLTAWHTIEHRAQQLKTQIEKAIPEGKVNLVGHSMGGLDARYLASALGFSERVASVTTIGTPNRGSLMGDIAHGLIPHKAMSVAERLLRNMNSSGGALKQVTRVYCTGEFAKVAPNVSGVAYYSATTAIPSPVMKSSLPFFWLPHRILSKLEGDNDGFVSVDSARWGEHICTYAGDHYAQIGQFLGRSRGMDYIRFYKDIFGRLSRDGM